MEKSKAVDGRGREREAWRNGMQGLMTRFNRVEADLGQSAERWVARRVVMSGAEETGLEARATRARERGTLNGVVQIRPRIVFPSWPSQKLEFGDTHRIVFLSQHSQYPESGDTRFM